MGLNFIKDGNFMKGNNNDVVNIALKTAYRSSELLVVCSLPSHLSRLLVLLFAHGWLCSLT